MLTPSNALLATSGVIVAVLVTIALGCLAGWRCAQKLPRLSGLLGFLSSLLFAFGPIGILVVTMKGTLVQSVVCLVTWLLFSGVAWGSVLYDYGHGHRHSKRLARLEGLYLIGFGSVLTGTILNFLTDFGTGADDGRFWCQHVLVFAIVGMVVVNLGLLTLGLFHWRRGGAPKALPLSIPSVIAVPPVQEDESSEAPVTAAAPLNAVKPATSGESQVNKRSVTEDPLEGHELGDAAVLTFHAVDLRDEGPAQPEAAKSEVRKAEVLDEDAAPADQPSGLEGAKGDPKPGAEK